jgi:hypothetical protein
MARYVLKRKTYGLGQAAENTIGGVTGGIGKALDSTPAAIAGGLAGGSMLGGAIGFGPLGWLVGAGIGAAATRGLGKGLKSAGNTMGGTGY